MSRSHTNATLMALYNTILLDVISGIFCAVRFHVYLGQAVRNLSAQVKGSLTKIETSRNMTFTYELSYCWKVEHLVRENHQIKLRNSIR